MIAAVTTILVRDLRATLRSGYFLVVGIVTPLALAVVLNIVFSGVSSGNLGISVGHLDRDGTPIAAELTGVLRSLDGGLLEVTELDPGADPERALADHDLRAVIVVPAGFAEAVADPAADRAAGPAEISVVADPDAPISAGVARAVVSSFTQQLDRARLAGAAAVELGLDIAPDTAPDTFGGWSTDWEAGAVRTVDVGAAERLDPSARMAAAMSTMFIVIVTLLGVTSLLYERDGGTLARLLVAPIPSAAVVIAKVVLSIVLASIAGLALVIATSVLIGASWGPAAGVVAVVVGFALAATGITVLIAGAARTTEAASAIQSTVAVLLAVLGGGLVPIPGGGLLDVASLLTPHRWFLDGLESMTTGTWTDALPAAGVLVAIAVVLGVPGVWMTRRRIIR